MLCSVLTIPAETPCCQNGWKSCYHRAGASGGCWALPNHGRDNALKQAQLWLGTLKAAAY